MVFNIVTTCRQGYYVFTTSPFPGFLLKCLFSAKATGGRMAFLYSGQCTSKARLDGKTAIVTGCNTGIGKETVVDFLRRGCRVIMACRDLVKTEAAVNDVKQKLSDLPLTGKIIVKHLDLASLASVRKCAEEINKEEEAIHILVNNAGVMLCPKSETEDGFELQMGTNHLGHFLFTLLLLRKIRHSGPARIINVSSSAHKGGVNNFEDINWKKNPYNALSAYSQSKLANVHFTKELAHRLGDNSDVRVYAVHPGWVKTELGRHIDSLYFRGFRSILGFFIGPFMKSSEQGAQTQIYCAVDEEAGKETSLYYVDCRAVAPHPRANDREAAERLFELSLELVQHTLTNEFE